MSRRKEAQKVGFIGERYQAVKLCEMFCIVDCLPDDPAYRVPAAYNCIIYYQKVIKEKPWSLDVAQELTDEAKRLDEEWKQDPERERKLKERDWCNRVIRRRWNEKQSILAAGERPRRWSGKDDRPKRKYTKRKNPAE